MFRVTVTEKDGQASSYDFDDVKSEVSIGRVKGNDIVLPKGNVSKRHSRIVVKDGKFIIVDLKSTNGTFVNGRKISSPHVVKGDDKVYIGDFVLGIDTSVALAPPAPAPAPAPAMGIQELSPSRQPLPPSMAGGGAPGPAPMSSPGLGGPGVPPMSGGPMSGGPGAPPMNGGGPGAFGSPSPLSSSSSMNNPPSLGGGSVDSYDAPSGQIHAHSSPAPAPSPPGGGLGGGLPKPSGGLPKPNKGLGAPSAPRSPGLPPRKSPLGGADPAPARGRMPTAPTSKPAPRHSRPSSPGISPGDRSGSSPLSLRNGKSGSSASLPPYSAPAPVVEPAPMPAAGGMPSIQSPGAAAVVPKPDFVSEVDARFADLQARAAEIFFQGISPEELPTHYPPSEEDRHHFGAAARDAVSQAGGGADLADHLLSEIVGLGPLENLLDDQSVEEIHVNAFDQILFRRGGQVVAAERSYSHPDFLFFAAQRLLGGRMADPDAEPMEEVRFSDGTRVTIVMPPLAPRGPILTVRKSVSSTRTLDDLVGAGVLSSQMSQLLRNAVECGRSILVAGPRHSGCAEMMNALGALIPEGSRTVVVEDKPGVKLPQSSAVVLENSSTAGDAYGLRYLLQAAMRLDPDRVLVNGLSGPEAYDWVTSAAAGTFGSMAITQGVSATDALSRVMTLCQLGAPDLSPGGLREQVARGVHLILVMHRSGDGSPRVQQIAEVQGVDFDAFRMHDIFHFRVEGNSGSFVATGYVPAFYEAMRSAGMSVDNGIFNL